MELYPADDRVRLRLPFDPEKGTLYIRETLKILDSLNIPKAEREAIDHGTLEKICGVKLVK
jgi:aminocarboxymuconate-semialdehyde decarboxylase